MHKWTDKTNLATARQTLLLALVVDEALHPVFLVKRQSGGDEGDEQERFHVCYTTMAFPHVPLPSPALQRC